MRRLWVIAARKSARLRLTVAAMRASAVACSWATARRRRRSMRATVAAATVATRMNVMSGM